MITGGRKEERRESCVPFAFDLDDVSESYNQDPLTSPLSRSLAAEHDTFTSSCPVNPRGPVTERGNTPHWLLCGAPSCVNI